MVSVPVWIESWVHECCGQERRVGETKELLLTFSGDVAAATEPDGYPAEALARLRSGQTIEIAIKKRDGASVTVKVTLGQYPGG